MNPADTYKRLSNIASLVQPISQGYVSLNSVQEYAETALKETQALMAALSQPQPTRGRPKRPTPKPKPEETEQA